MHNSLWVFLTFLSFLSTAFCQTQKLTCSATFHNFLRAAKAASRQQWTKRWDVDSSDFATLKTYTKRFLIGMLAISVTMGLCFYCKDQTIYKRYLKQFDGKRMQAMHKLMTMKIEPELFQDYQQEYEIKRQKDSDEEEEEKNVEQFFQQAVKENHKNLQYDEEDDSQSDGEQEEEETY